MVKCKDCSDLRAYFVGYAYCKGDLMVDQPVELSFTNYECGNTDSENYTEVLDDPNEDVECANLKTLHLLKAAK
jgi:hypothetical protein